MNYYEALKQYFNNGCVLHPDKPPIWGEVHYEEYIRQKIKEMGIKPGDVIRVEEKYPGKMIKIHQGVILSISDIEIRLLTQGKRIWKDRSNQKYVIINYITSINKLKDGAPMFDILKVDPFYSIPDREKETESDVIFENRRKREFEERMKESFPEIDTEKNIILYLLFDFCWNYANGQVKDVVINIIKDTGESIPLSKYKMKHIYPNNSYFSACGVKNTDNEFEGILVFFDSMDELEHIRLISCLWTVDIDRKTKQFLTIVYPKFIKVSGNVFNIISCSTDMMLYEKSLHSPSVFSGRMEEEFSNAFLYMSNSEGEIIYEIMHQSRDLDATIFDVALCLHNNNLKNMISDMCSDEKQIVEVLIKETDVKSKDYIWPY